MITVISHKLSYTRLHKRMQRSNIYIEPQAAQGEFPLYTLQMIWASDFSQSAHRKGPTNRNPYRAAARACKLKKL